MWGKGASVVCNCFSVCFFLNKDGLLPLLGQGVTTEKFHNN